MLGRVVRFLQPQQYAENEVIFRQGDTGDRFYIVETGMAVRSFPCQFNLTVCS